MRRALGVATLALALFGSSCHHAELPPPVLAANDVAWLGIDYSRVRMVGIGAFNEPDKIFPGFLKIWNGLFIEEMMGELEHKLGKPVRAEVDAVMRRNERASTKQIHEQVQAPGQDLTAADVAAMVRSYDLGGQSGVGLVLVMDLMNKTTQRGCVLRAFVDLHSKEVLETTRGCFEAGGFGFRNYWFSPVKDAIRKW